MVKVAPSILSADFARLADEIARVEAAGADWLHIDVMDGHFVPNLTIGAPVVDAIRKVTKLPLDVHLMIEKPDLLIPQFIMAGADYITVHQEEVVHLDRTIQLIKQLGAKAGVVLNPATPVNTLEDILPLLDMVLIMSVNPGFGGQKFIASTLKKVEKLRDLRIKNNYSYLIEIDGGMNKETMPLAIEAGVDVFVAGSAIYDTPDVSVTTKAFKKILSSRE